MIRAVGKRIKTSFSVSSKRVGDKTRLGRMRMAHNIDLKQPLKDVVRLKKNKEIPKKMSNMKAGALNCNITFNTIAVRELSEKDCLKNVVNKPCLVA